MSSGPEPQPAGGRWAEVISLQNHLYRRRAQRTRRRQPDPDGAQLVGWTEAGYAVRDPATYGAVLVLYRAEAADLIGISVERLDLLALLARFGLPMPQPSTPTRRHPVPELLTPLEPGARITGKQRTEVRTYVAARYQEERVSIRTIAAGINRSYGFVLDLLNEAGVPLRPPSANNHIRRRS